MTSTKAGRKTFHGVHDMQHMHTTREGRNGHGMQVARKNSDRTFDIVGQVLGLKTGDEKALTLDLAPGDHEFQCDAIEEVNGWVSPHYVKSMHAPFKVTG